MMRKLLGSIFHLTNLPSLAVAQIGVITICLLFFWACQSTSKTEVVKAEIKETEKELQVFIGEKPVLTYHKATVFPHDTLPQYYQRSGYIHPVYSPEGQVVTDGMPVGHTHQHGLFFAWVNTTYQGAKTDFWNQQDNSGTVRHKSVKQIRNEETYAEFVTEQEHLSIRGTDTTIVLLEEWTVRIHNQQDAFHIDFKTHQKNISKDTLYINEYHYGGFAFRGSAQWNAKDPIYSDSMQVLTNEGFSRNPANHSHPDWVTAYGKVNNTLTGVAIKGLESNFRQPQAIRVHPVMPYLCFAPMFDGAFEIPPNGEYEAAYQIVVFDGEVDDGKISNLFND